MQVYVVRAGTYTCRCTLYGLVHTRAGVRCTGWYIHVQVYVVRAGTYMYIILRLSTNVTTLMKTIIAIIAIIVTI